MTVPRESPLAVDSQKVSRDSEPMRRSSMSPDAAAVVSAIAAAASAVLTLIAVVIAAATLIGARKDAQRATAQAETDRREDLRPYLTPELERELLTHGTLNLVIKNWGRTAARDVQVAFTPPPPTDLVSLPDSDMMKWLYEAYAKPITLWPPRWRTGHSGHRG